MDTSTTPSNLSLSHTELPPPTSHPAVPRLARFLDWLYAPLWDPRVAKLGLRLQAMTILTRIRRDVFLQALAVNQYAQHPRKAQA